MTAIAVEPTIDAGVRCWRCGKLLFEHAARPWRLKCSRCNAVNCSP